MVITSVRLASNELRADRFVCILTCIIVGLCLCCDRIIMLLQKSNVINGQLMLVVGKIKNR